MAVIRHALKLNKEILMRTCKFFLTVTMFFAILISCTAAGGLKPTIFTQPPGYLESFPLGSLTETDLQIKIGPPDRTTEIMGKKALVYQLGKGYGLRTFTYILDTKGIVEDVLYNDSSPYNGLTAKSLQSKKASNQ